ncbi:heme o synthase [Xanthobacter sediminis]|uniref:heme o synthase n=1 Tax=Xanthobacter sediminis TaxID=3119926 RepID=UPI00372A2373
MSDIGISHTGLGAGASAARAGLAPAEGLATPGDYLALMKPRVMSLVVFTALVGLVRAPGDLHPLLGFTALVCIAVGAGAAGALNMWWDADIDALMARTRGRPVPAGRVSPREALAFGLTLAAFSVGVLGLLVNPLAALLLAFTIFFYVVVYTMWLKRATPQNIVIGGLAGALPPLVAWAAAAGTVSLEPLLLVAIIFFWTPPHFWALALFRADDYARAGVPMLPVVAGPDATRLQILLYTLMLVPLAASPALLGLAGPAYGAVALVAGAVMLRRAVRVFRVRRGEAAVKAARGLFAFSILYLFALFAALLGEALAAHVLEGRSW